MNRHEARETQAIDVPGVGRVGMAVYGADNGYPVLALHGAPACRLMYDVADETARTLGLTLYCPDRPGYGLSPLDGPDRTIASRSAALEALADHLGLDRFALLGISGGAPYATALAARIGPRATAVLLVSPMGPLADYLAATPAAEARRTVAAGHRWFFLRLPHRPRLLSANASLSAAAFKAAPRAFARLFATSLSAADREVLARPNNAESLVRMTLEALRSGADGGVADLQVFAQPWQVDFSAVTAPAVLYQGTADRIVPAAVSVWLADRLPRCTLERLDRAGHFWVYDHVGEVLATLARLALRS